jgi:hypothetical protein
MAGALFKTRVVIWSEKDPVKMELSELAREAESGDAYCSGLRSERVADPERDPDWDGTDFFAWGEQWAEALVGAVKGELAGAQGAAGEGPV